MNGLPIRIENLDVSYGDVPVLHGIDLTVAPGEFIALLGASGCGKTTLLRALAGFIPVADGHIEVGGEPVGTLPPERRNMAMMFQSYALWPHMNAAQNIGYGLRLRRWPKARIAERVREMVALVGLEGLERRNVTRLSGGQRQRVALARALAIDPPILLLDEPLSNLDARIRQNMRHEVRSLQQRLGLTAILVTHDREEAMSMADRMVILDTGRIAQVGTPEEVYQRPDTAFVAAFMGAENAYPVNVRRANGAVFVSGPHVAGETRLPFAASLDERGVHCPAGNGGPMVARFRSEAAAAGGPCAGGAAGPGWGPAPGGGRRRSSSPPASPRTTSPSRVGSPDRATSGTSTATRCGSASTSSWSTTPGASPRTGRSRSAFRPGRSTFSSRTPHRTGCRVRTRTRTRVPSRARTPLQPMRRAAGHHHPRPSQRRQGNEIASIQPPPPHDGPGRGGARRPPCRPHPPARAPRRPWPRRRSPPVLPPAARPPRTRSTSRAAARRTWSTT